MAAFERNETRDSKIVVIIFIIVLTGMGWQVTSWCIVYCLSILRYFQFSEVSQGWRCLRIRMPTDQVPCKTKGISNLLCALHTHMLTNAISVVIFEIGVIPW